MADQFETDSEGRSSVVDFTKFDFETLRSFPTSEGVSKYIPDMTEGNFFDFERFVESHSLGYKYYYDRDLKHIVITRMGPPSPQHEAVHASVTYSVQSYNVALNGDPNYPILIRGSSQVNVGSQIHSPDAQYKVFNRPCPNMVVEASDTQGLAELVRKLRLYIENTNNIMFALGFKFLPVQGGVGLLAIGYSREFGTQQPLFVINFGTTNISPQAEASILQAAQLHDTALFTGLGYGDAECNLPNMQAYRIEIRREWILCSDYVGVQLFEGENFNHIENNLFIDLYQVRRTYFHNA
jgi:hypothetical protein